MQLRVEYECLRGVSYGRSASHRRSDRAHLAAGVDITYVVPRAWAGSVKRTRAVGEPVRIAEAVLRSAFDVNRHSYACVDAVARVGG